MLMIGAIHICRLPGTWTQRVAESDEDVEMQRGGHERMQGRAAGKSGVPQGRSCG